MFSQRKGSSIVFMCIVAGFLSLWSTSVFAQATTAQNPLLLPSVISDKTDCLQVLGYKNTTLYVQCGKKVLAKEFYKHDEVKSVSIPPQKAGQTLKLYLKDSNSNQSPPLTYRVERVADEKMKKKLKRPKILTNSITSKTRKLKVIGWKGTKLIVKNDQLKTIKTIKYRKTGTKTVKISAQKKNSTLYFYLKAGNKRGTVVRRAVKDETSPDAPELTKMSKSRVRIKGEPGTAVYVKNTKGKLIRKGFIVSSSGLTLKNPYWKKGHCTVQLRDAAGNRSKTAKLKPLKFSLTIAEERPASDSDYRPVRTCVFDVDSQKMKTIISLKHNAQYTLTYYAGKGDLIYYVTNPDKNREDGDQLYSYNIKTKKSKQLTDNLYAINAIVPMKGNKLFLAAVEEGTHTVSPMCYDISSGQLKNLSWDPDLFVRRVAQDPQTGTVYIVGYSNSEDYKRRNDFNEGKIKKCGIDNTIYTIAPDGSHKVIYVCKKRYIDYFVVNRDRIICCTKIIDQSNEYLMGDPITKMVNLKTDKESVLSKELYLDWDIDYLDNSGRYLYMDDGEQIVKKDLKTKITTVLYTIDSDDAYLNNVRAIY